MTSTTINSASLSLIVLCSLLATLAACGADQAAPKEQNTCEAGFTPHPISGECVKVGQDSPADLGKDEDLSAQDQGVQPPPKDMHVNEPLDQGSLEDMHTSNPKDDMGPDMMVVEPMEVQRFVAIGDTGTGSDMQLKVGQSIGQACQALGGCDFGLLLGDNAYNSGFDSADDPRFEDFFVRPYGHLGFPFYIVLGNHDLGGEGLGVSLDLRKGDYQVSYSQKNPQWLMPAKHYQVQRGPLWLMGLNTTDVFFNRADAQGRELERWISQAPAQTWKIAFGHHPYISNGPHGNAGDYEGLPFVPIANGEHVKSFMDDHICGKVDLYLSGHDHNIQDLHASCGTEFIVSGAGAKTTDLEGVNPVYYESDEPGFFILEATSSTITVRGYDQDGVLMHTRQITR